MNWLDSRLTHGTVLVSTKTLLVEASTSVLRLLCVHSPELKGQYEKSVNEAKREITPCCEELQEILTKRMRKCRV